MVITGPLSAMITNKNPGPGSYEIPSSKSRRCFSIHPRIERENHEILDVPGPGRCR